ncbi:hypothetical protein D9758_004510 [Tetrapyrgos nigripes]|uniref:Uncharacterized protein n=1 Tax=Tetrapyrgos nigripes TaxID=182062 RepID=A0A8H5GNM3_9AGAR|nr:hypothetical protein D9758_004510 [Tetrapyrgos nigripes]
MSSETIPLKIRVDVRDLWDSSTSAVKEAADSLTKTLGHTITPEAEWPALWGELKDHFPDKSGFVLAVSRYTVAWYELLLSRVENDAHLEWTEALLEELSASGRGPLLLKIEPCPANAKTRPITNWNKNTHSFFLGIPKSDLISQTRSSTFFEKDFDSLFGGAPGDSSAGPIDDEDPDLVHVSNADANGKKTSTTVTETVVPVSRTTDVSDLTRRLPALDLLARPNELFKATAPHILMVNQKGDEMTVQCSHEPSLVLLANYLKKWGKTNPNDSLRASHFLQYLLNLQEAMALETLIQLQDSSTESSAATAKKKRRQTAIYPKTNSSNKPQKPFSRSAAKRESVMALGSIEHLQYFFTKAGIKAKKNPLLDKPHHGLVPALGGNQPTISINTNNASISSIGDLPPTPVIPAPPTNVYSHVKTVEVNPESLLPGVIEDLGAVSRAWHLDHDDHDDTPEDSIYFDVLSNLQITTRAIRSIRNYILSFPDERHHTTTTREENFRSSRLTASAAGSSSARTKSPARAGPGGAAAGGSSTSAQAQSQSQQQKDPLTLIRRSALEVLAVLRELEEKARLPLSDDAYDAQSDGGGSHGGRDLSNSGNGGGPPSRLASPSQRPVDLPEGVGLGLHEVDADTSVAFSFVRVQGDKSVPVWEDPDADEFSDEDEKEKRERWDERLVVGSGWLYKRDLTMKDVVKERNLVREYVDTVDEVLFHGEKTDESGRPKERGWVKERRRLINKGGKRRASAGDVGGKAIFMGEPGFRRISTGMLPNIMGGASLSAEPRNMGGIEEGDEEENGVDAPNTSVSTDTSSIDEDELPEWAQKDAYENRDLDRAHALIYFLLPPAFHDALSPSTPSSAEPLEDDNSSSPSSSASMRTAFLDCLSSGQLLCLAYNAGVRKSKKPWGYVNHDGIHDIISLERAEEDNQEKKKTSWTFRRTDNLRLWAGSLKLRYMLPIILPTHVIPITPSTSTGSSGSRPGTPKLGGSTPLNSPPPQVQRFTNTNEPPLLFDAKVVARKDDGWEDMLEAVLVRWMWRVVDERRGDRV